MLNFAEQTGSGAVMLVWSFLLTTRHHVYPSHPSYTSFFLPPLHPHHHCNYNYSKPIQNTIYLLLLTTLQPLPTRQPQCHPALADTFHWPSIYHPQTSSCQQYKLEWPTACTKSTGRISMFSLDWCNCGYCTWSGEGDSMGEWGPWDDHVEWIVQGMMQKM